ncbi:MAG: AMP-binding protein [Rhodobacter sp.]|uniref:AMP-binding protein n=1 Tax=Pararhodobacter sp. TaxID=2127056 RepID=UPI001D4AB818|nr:AMP-binding protein [Pararhodobacter sp.]MCB1344787.1 AMP-binding protein [Paracoccaceae bacterium]MCC0072653.1 AMP-binding protein [Rhodobacter sp.]HPD93221.1 AMP-binding protein [Pararhodobacter sp.]
MRPITAATVHDAFGQAALRWPDRPFLATLPETAKVYGIAPGEMTYGAAQDEVARLRTALAAAGLGPGHRLMLLLENRPAFFLWWLAANGLGASVVPVNPDLRAAELDYMIGHVTPALALAIPSRVADLRGAAQAAGVAMPVAEPGAPLPRVTAAPVFDGDEAAVLYTSGSTGRPKGCVLGNDYFIRSGNWYLTEGGLCALADGDRMITPLPIFHMNAMACSFMAMIGAGGCLIALDRFHPRTWWQSVRAARATCLHYLGVMPSMLMGLPASDDDRAPDVRFGFGAGIDPKLHAAFESRFGFPLVEAWAMTETGGGNAIAASQPPRRVGESCLGRPGPGVEIRVLGDDGAPAAPGEPGELLIRAAGDDPRAGFFREYYRDPQATAEAWAGGWFHTGDLVRLDADGSMVFVDRKKNVIRRSGENIAAVEVESVLARHPAVRAAAVAPVPDALRGDEVFACLVADAPSPDLATQIATWALGQMAYYKVPGHIAFVDSLPLTATNKVQRATLKTLAASLVGAPGTVDTTALKRRQVP